MWLEEQPRSLSSNVNSPSLVASLLLSGRGKSDRTCTVSSSQTCCRSNTNVISIITCRIKVSLCLFKTLFSLRQRNRSTWRGNTILCCAKMLRFQLMSTKTPGKPADAFVAVRAWASTGETQLCLRI